MRNGMVQVMSELKNNALNYVKKGFKVFPLKPNTKGEQVLESWKYESTTNLNQIDYWWNKNPNYNIGLVTGNGLLVIDIDVKNGKDGLQSIKKLLREDIIFITMLIRQSVIVLIFMMA